MNSATVRHFAEVSQAISPQLLAYDRYLKLDGPLAGLFPLGRIQRGSILLFEGAENSGVTSLLFELLSSGEIRKSWCALVGFDDIGFLAAFESGVDLSRVVCVPDAGKRTTQVVAILMEAFPVVVFSNPRFISSSQIRNLIARVRVNKSIIMVLQYGGYIFGREKKGLWPGSYDYLLNSCISDISGLGRGEGFIKKRTLSVSLKDKRAGSALHSVTLLV